MPFLLLLCTYVVQVISEANRRKLWDWWKNVCCKTCYNNSPQLASTAGFAAESAGMEHSAYFTCAEDCLAEC